VILLVLAALGLFFFYGPRAPVATKRAQKPSPKLAYADPAGTQAIKTGVKEVYQDANGTWRYRVKVPWEKPAAAPASSGRTWNPPSSGR